MKKALTLSIVIPVYNEEVQLKTCLDAIAKQTLSPDEVVVVDNNSTDSSATVASQYEFVRLVLEKRQGVLFAARTGMDASNCEIIGRIDVDTRLPANWVQKVQDYFVSHPGVDAVTGNCYFYDFPFRKIFRKIHHGVYYSLQKFISGTEILWGSNMAIRKSVWQNVYPVCLARPIIPEDIDLSLHLQDKGFVIRRYPELLAEVSLRHGNIGPLSIISYLWPWPLTYWANKRYAQAVMIGAVLFLVWLFVLPLSIVLKLLSSLQNLFKHLFA